MCKKFSTPFPLCLRISSRYLESGGAFKVQIYCPYIVINKTGLPFAVKSARSTRTGSKDVAGEVQPGQVHLLTDQTTPPDNGVLDALSKAFPFRKSCLASFKT